MTPRRRNETPPDSALNVRCFTDIESLPPGYAEFFAEAAEENFWQSLDWFQTLAQTTLQQNEIVRIYVAESSAEPAVPMAAVVMKSAPSNGRTLRTGLLASHTNFYSMVFSPIISKACDAPADALERIVRYLKDEKPRWHAVSFSALPDEYDDRDFGRLTDALQRNGYVVSSQVSFGNYFDSFDGISYSDYVKQLPSGVRRLDRKFDDDDRLRFELVDNDDPERLEAAIADYHKVYDTSWKTEEHYPEFIPEFLRLCALQGLLRLGFIFVDDLPVATQIWITENGNSTIYKIAYDEAYKKIGVGSMLSLKMFRHAIEIDGVREIDYGSGDDAYKKTWLKNRRERWDVVGYNRFTPKGAFDIARFSLKRAIKNACAVVRQKSGSRS